MRCTLQITPSVDLNQWLKRLYTQLYELTNQNSMRVPKIVKPTNKKTLLYNFWDKCDKQPLSLCNYAFNHCGCFFNLSSIVFSLKIPDFIEKTVLDSV